MEIKLKYLLLGSIEEKTIGIALGETLEELSIGLDHETIHTETVDIQLVVNGKDIGLVEFFKNLKDNYFKYLTEVAQNLVLEDVKDKLSELANTCNSAQNKIEQLDNNISWDIQCLKQSLKEKED